MRKDDVLAFVRRDWDAIGRNRLAFWAEQYRREGAAPARRAAAHLYEHAQRVGSTLFSNEQRAVDLASHLRLREQLDRAAHAFRDR